MCQYLASHNFFWPSAERRLLAAKIASQEKKFWRPYCRVTVLKGETLSEQRKTTALNRGAWNKKLKRLGVCNLYLVVEFIQMVWPDWFRRIHVPEISWQLKCHFYPPNYCFIRIYYCLVACGFSLCKWHGRQIAFKCDTHMRLCRPDHK